MVSVLSLAVGPIGGDAYVIIGIKSTPPFAALFELLGMLVGESGIAVFFAAKS